MSLPAMRSRITGLSIRSTQRTGGTELAHLSRHVCATVCNGVSIKQESLVTVDSGLEVYAACSIPLDERGNRTPPLYSTKNMIL